MPLNETLRKAGSTSDGAHQRLPRYPRVVGDHGRIGASSLRLHVPAERGPGETCVPFFLRVIRLRPGIRVWASRGGGVRASPPIQLRIDRPLRALHERRTGKSRGQDREVAHGDGPGMVA